MLFLNFIFGIFYKEKIKKKYKQDDIVIVCKRTIIYRAAWKINRMMNVVEDERDNLVKVSFDDKTYFVPRRTIRLTNDRERMLYYIFGSEVLCHEP